jgi:outer membrane receptor protein involved in Fe transport
MVTAAPAVAQVSGHASPSEASTLGEVVVTARKREESIMATPVIMQALTSALVQDRRITNTEQLSQVTPGLTILTVGGTAGTFPPVAGVTVRIARFALAGRRKVLLAIDVPAMTDGGGHDYARPCRVGARTQRMATREQNALIS